MWLTYSVKKLRGVTVDSGLILIAVRFTRLGDSQGT